MKGMNRHETNRYQLNKITEWHISSYERIFQRKRLYYIYDLINIRYTQALANCFSWLCRRNNNNKHGFLFLFPDTWSIYGRIHENAIDGICVYVFFLFEQRWDKTLIAFAESVCDRARRLCMRVHAHSISAQNARDGCALCLDY